MFDFPAPMTIPELAFLAGLMVGAVLVAVPMRIVWLNERRAMTGRWKRGR